MKVVNIYIVYKVDKIYVKTSLTLVNCLFGAVSLYCGPMAEHLLSEHALADFLHPELNFLYKN